MAMKIPKKKKGITAGKQPESIVALLSYGDSAVISEIIENTGNIGIYRLCYGCIGRYQARALMFFW